MDAGAWRQAWESALDDFELEIERAELLLAETHELVDGAPAHPPPAQPFVPPTGLGPMPPELAERGRQILARQLAVAADLSAGLARNRAEQAVLRRMSLQSPPPPSMIDQRG